MTTKTYARRGINSNWNLNRATMCFILIVFPVIFVAMIANQKSSSTPEKIGLIAEDWSRRGGTTPEEEFGPHALIPEKMRNINKKYMWVYKAKSWRIDCKSYMDLHPDDYAVCSRNSFVIMSNHPLDDIFVITKLEVK